MAELGFGFLRLPMVGEGPEKQVDLDAGKALVDRFLNAGGRYFDTDLDCDFIKPCTQGGTCCGYVRQKDNEKKEHRKK